MPQTSRQKAWYEKNREAIAIRAKERRATDLDWRKRDRVVQRRKHLKRLYGITVEDYDRMLQAQGGVCAACGSPPGERNFDVDHNHVTGAVRGLLCHNCNVSIGYAKDDPSVLEKLAAYLRKNKD